MMKLLDSTIILKKELKVSQLEEMWNLFNRYYSFSNKNVFFRDLEEKTHVILFHDKKDKIMGFKAIYNYCFFFEGKLLNIIYSGNAIIHPKFWGTQELVRTLSQFMCTLISQKPHLPLYWFLICSGFRTYRSLSIFFNKFYPKFNESIPLYEEKLMEALAIEKFPDEYRNGVIYVKEKRDCLVHELADHQNRSSPHIDYFFLRNPGFSRGNELVCLAEFSIENTRGPAKKIAKEALSLGLTH